MNNQSLGRTEINFKELRLYQKSDQLSGTIHLRRRHLLGEGSKFCQICRRIVVKKTAEGRG